MENKVLFIASDFWPTQTGGTIRVEKLLKYFPYSNWKGVVFTKRLKGFKAIETIHGVKIYRTKQFNLPSLYVKVKNMFTRRRKGSNVDGIAGTSNGRLADYVFVPDVDIFWALGSVFRMKEAVKKEKINVIYSTSPFASVHIVALIYKKIFNRSIKWVVEFRDPWTFNPFRNRKFGIMDKLDHALESYVLKSCDTIIVTSEAYKYQFLEKYPKIIPSKINYIPNGYDPEDFYNLSPQISSDHKRIRLVHAGNFYGMRSIKPFLEALNILCKRHPDYANRLLVTQFGVIDPEGEQYLADFPCEIFKLENTIPHKESLQEIVNADWLLLIPGPGAGTMPGKLYEYLATGNPILCLVDEGPALELIVKLEIGYVCSPSDIEGTVQQLLNIIRNPLTKSPSLNAQAELERFDRKIIATRVASLLESVLHPTL